MTFKYSLVSDLHLDHPQPKTPPLEQNVIVAGDCGNGLIGLKYLNKLKRKGHSVFAVDGNHEHYANSAQGRTVEDTEAAFELGLEQDMAFEAVPGIWLVGCNGWYCVSDQSYWRSYMNDSRLIGINASQANALALRDAAFVDRMLTEIRGKAIVVTHTAPTMASLDPRFEGQFSNEWYWNPHMEPLLAKHRDKIAVWHHGHTHAPVDVVVDGVRIVTNPRGYLTPYTQLMDPETSRVYPSISSKLATRRLAASFPNPMQLAKQGNSTYIRSFYLADDDDELVVSADWSSVELVLIGDFSHDPGFKEVFGQLPYGDLHSGAAADCLAVKTLPGLTEEEFMLFKFGENPNGRILRNTATGAIMEPKDFFKHARGTPVGKGANFNYWYSGSLSTVGGNLGWSSDEMWEAVDRYRARFPLAEKWRVDTQTEVTEFGFVSLPDGHRRARYEATQAWASAMRHKFAEIDASPSLNAYAELAIKRIQSRARNQAVNAMIQGSCATLAKQSILNLIPMLEAAGIADKVRFMMPIHDELVFSVHRDVVMIFIPLLRKAMCTHPNVVKTLPLDCTVSIGKTFRPYNATPFSQWELDEAAPYEDLIPPELQGKKLPDDIVARVVNFLADAKVPANDIGKAKVVA